MNEVIVIDDDGATAAAGPSNRVVAQPYASASGTASGNTYIDLTSSPDLQRPLKRPRLTLDESGPFMPGSFHSLGHDREAFDDAAVDWPELIEDVNFSSPVPPQRKEPEPPYFVDPKLHVKMYRGPGHELFPVPVNSNSEFQKACDRWDEKALCRRMKQTRYNSFGAYVDENAPVDDSDDEHWPKLKPPTAAQQECLAKILEVLPDIQHEFVLSKITAQNETWDFGGDAVEIVPDSNQIVEQILSLQSYPKEPKDKGIAPCHFEAETGKTVKWDIANRQHKNYLKNTVAILASQFEHVPTHYVDKTVKEKKELWSAFIHIQKQELNYFQNPARPYPRHRQPRVALEKKYQTTDALLEPAHYNMLICELQAVKQHLMREHLKKDQEEAKTHAEKQNLEEHKIAGTIIECQCCFDDEVPINRAVTCMAASGEHSFCFTCVENLANTQIGMMRHELLCMDGSGCKEKLDMEAVGRAIPLKTFDRLLFNEQQAEIKAANLEGLEQCPSCDFKAICDPIEENPIFHCQNPDCFRVTCRKCHETSHLPKTCEEVVKDRKLDAKHKVEEARSAAVMRPCPKCKSMIIKELGCNKMRCTCGAVLCYYCKQDLSDLRDGYMHFSGRGSTGKCPLYDAQGIDRHAVEADEAELKAIQAAKETDETIQEEELRIETGKVKHQPHISALEVRIQARLHDNLGRAHLPPIPPGPPLPEPWNDMVNPAGAGLDAAMRARILRMEQQLRNEDRRGRDARRAVRREAVRARVANPVFLPPIQPVQPAPPPQLAGRDNIMLQRYIQNLHPVAHNPPPVGQWLNQNADVFNEVHQADRINNFRAETERRRNNRVQRRNSDRDIMDGLERQSIARRPLPGQAGNQQAGVPQMNQAHANPATLNVNINLLNQGSTQRRGVPPAPFQDFGQQPLGPLGFAVPPAMQDPLVRRRTAPVLGANWDHGFGFDLNNANVAAEVTNAQRQPRQQQAAQPVNQMFGYNLDNFYGDMPRTMEDWDRLEEGI